ncbi:hypothetical protein PENARI_c197G07871 [Penicillium arizonense]|uniref:Uncharacterized protein n=1 Tax=Penicillium arizonense TaxID=1835702 RepID=A0A1F5L0G5_PENAI|nr:hypothetical protein PENARI_c197G07871 [Penicillium arizonense]OGE46546.1 hypothetical protein PENARI_c197G07871 [Penicillium arizonense]
MASNSGVKKSSLAKDNHSKLVEMQELAERNAISSAKIKSAAEQVDLSEGPRPADKPSEIHDSDQPNNIDPADQANAPLPSHSSVVQSIERDDTPMHDAGSVHQAAEGSSSNINERSSMAGHRQNRTDLSPEARGASEPRDPELLASLDPSEDDEETDAVVDGWGTLRGSTFVILQYGPRHGARYKFKYRNGYTNDDMNNISQRELRISQIKASPRSKVWRYTKHNVVGIYGIASEERKNSDKEYKSDPCSWLKIKWKDLKSEDTDNMQNSCSWIPRSDFTRFCNGKRAADAKIKEVWEKQEERYLRVLQSDAGRGNEDRSPTPCPLGSAARQSPERQPARRLNSPAIQHSSAGQHEVPPSSTANLHPGTGSPANPINLDGDEAPHNPVSSGAALNSNTNAVQNKSNLAIGQRAILTEAEFIAEREKAEGWDDLDDMQRERRLTVAKAMYDLYQDTIAQNMQSQGSVNTPIGQRPGAAVAAH